MQIYDVLVSAVLYLLEIKQQCPWKHENMASSGNSKKVEYQIAYTIYRKITHTRSFGWFMHSFYCQFGGLTQAKLKV